MKCNQKCNPVYNFQQNGMSRKMLVSKIIQNGRSINYANSQSATIYTTILSLDYTANKKLLLSLKYKLYMKYMNHLITCNKHNSHAIIEMKEYIIANLTREEYNFVFEIKIDVSENIVINTTISKTYYISVDANKKFFLIKNYNGEYIRPYTTYEFNLEDPSNLNTVFCLSQKQDCIPVEGLIYTGVPGTIGASLIFNAPGNISYNLSVFNSLLTVSNAYEWGYGQPLLPIIDSNHNVYKKSSYTSLLTEQYTSLSVYYNFALKFFIQTSAINFFTTSSVNYNYLFYYGTYYIQVPKIYTMALLNKDQEYSIRYRGDINKSTTADVVGTTKDGTYNFYYDKITITIYEPFTPISLYSQLYGYMGAIDTITFDPLAASSARPEFRNDHPIDASGIETLYGQTKLMIDYSNISMSLNNNESVSTSTSYGMYNGTYIFYTSEYITFLNKTKEDIFIVSGLNPIQGPGPDGNTNYTFYSGVIQVKVIGNFNKMSIYTFNKGYCKGRYVLNYGKQYNNYLPHSYPFTNINRPLLTESLPVIYNNSIALNSTLLDFTGDNGSTIVTGISRQSSNYNVILSDSSGNIVFVDLSSNANSAGNVVINNLENNIIPYNSTTQYTMKKGTYVFFNLSGLFITFMVNNKSIVINERYNAGYFFFNGTAPNGDQYIFNKSDKTALALLKPIVITVTNNFGYLSIATPSGYNGGKDLIAYKE